MKANRLHLTRPEAVRILERFMLAFQRRPAAAGSMGNLAVRQGVYLIGSMLTRQDDIGDVDLVVTVFAPGHEHAVHHSHIHSPFWRPGRAGMDFRKMLIPRPRGVEVQGQTWLGGDTWASPKNGRTPGPLEGVYPLWRAGELDTAWTPRVAALLDTAPVETRPALDPAVCWWPVQAHFTTEAARRLVAMTPANVVTPMARFMRWLIDWEVGWRHAPEWAAPFRARAEETRDLYLDICLEAAVSAFPDFLPILNERGGAAGLRQAAGAEADRFDTFTDPRAAGIDLPDRF